MQTLRYDLNPEHLDAVLSFMERTGLNRLMIFTGGVDQYGRPHTTEEAERWVAERRTVAEHLAMHSFGFDINVWSTLGHTSQIPWVEVEGYQCQVGHRGETVVDAVCPLDSRWRQTVAGLYALYATLGPDTLWIDDDFRYHNHGVASWTCFCPLHLEHLRTQLGHFFSRQALLAELANEPSGEVAEAWRETLNRALVVMLQAIRERVQAVSLNTGLGLMTSSPEVHAAEGRDWPRLL